MVNMTPLPWFFVSNFFFVYRLHSKSCGFRFSSGMEVLMKFGVNATPRRSSRRRYSVKKGVFRNFAKFTGKHPCQISFLINLKFFKSLFPFFWHRCFSCEFCEISKNTFSAEHLQTIASDLALISCPCESQLSKIQVSEK